MLTCSKEKDPTPEATKMLRSPLPRDQGPLNKAALQFSAGTFAGSCWKVLFYLSSVPISFILFPHLAFLHSRVHHRRLHCLPLNHGPEHEAYPFTVYNHAKFQEFYTQSWVARKFQHPFQCICMKSTTRLHITFHLPEVNVHVWYYTPLLI